MAQRHAATGSNRRRTPDKKKKTNKKVNVIIWGVILAVLLGTAIIVASNVHEGITAKVQNKQYPRSYSEYVEKAAEKYDLDDELIYAVIRTESNFNPDAESGADAHGLMQITSDTFEHYMNVREQSDMYSFEDIYDPAVNIDYGCYILRDLIEEFGNEECALAAYNAGPGNVNMWLEDPNISKDGKTLIVDNIPDSFEETRSYVKKVEETKSVYKKLYG